MSKLIRYMAIDPSMSNTAIVYGYIQDGIISCEGYKLLETEKTKNKQIRASSDTISRCKILHNGIQNSIKEWEPRVIFVETPSGSQSAVSMKGYGICCALIATMNPAPIQVTPHEVKMGSVGKKTASKKEMIDWASEKYPNLVWLYYGGKLQAKNEHLADAIATAHAGILTNDYERLITLI